VSDAAVAELWREARVLAERGAAEHSPSDTRRALVMLAIAGSSGDQAAFEAEVAAVHRACRALALDPIPLFDAASALVAEDDLDARQVLVTLARREAPPRRPLRF
jgi:hypothetical protein